MISISFEGISLTIRFFGVVFILGIGQEILPVTAGSIIREQNRLARQDDQEEHEFV